MFECPICLEITSKYENVVICGESYSVCPFCYHVIQTLRNHKKNFEVEIQKW